MGKIKRFLFGLMLVLCVFFLLTAAWVMGVEFTGDEEE